MGRDRRRGPPPPDPAADGAGVVDWIGPHGWTWSATDLGRAQDLDGPPPGVQPDGQDAPLAVRRRRVLPAAEVRVPFTVRRAEIADVSRGAEDADFDDLDRAARLAAEIENRAVFHGWPAAGIDGIAGTSSHPPLVLGEDASTYPATVARAVDALRRAGIAGPYALAIGPTGYTRIVEATENGGFPLFDHLRRILDGPVVWAPGAEGALVVSQRGGDFLFEVGQDLAVGYLDHDRDVVRLYLEESFTFRSVEPDAAIVLAD